MNTAATQPEPTSSAAWWSSRRLRYNIGLVVAGIAAFITYCIVLSIFSDAIPDAEITILTTAFQGVGYLVCMAVANVFYQLGPLSERWLRPKNPTAFRHTTFALGFWFSVALPFTIPALLAALAIFHPRHFQQ
jgi:uncharacterized membrane protein YgcG